MSSPLLLPVRQVGESLTRLRFQDIALTSAQLSPDHPYTHFNVPGPCNGKLFDLEEIQRFDNEGMPDLLADLRLHENDEDLWLFPDDV